MKLEHHFTVPAPVEDTWRSLLDLELVASCFPGAALTSASGGEFAGTVKVRLGPISLLYTGSGRFSETDEAAHRAVIEAAGRDSRGGGTASATVTLTVAGEGAGSGVTVGTDLSVTGRPAQMGRGLISDVGNKLTKEFADCIAGKVGTASSAEPAAAAGPPTPSTPAAPPAGSPTTSTTDGAASRTPSGTALRHTSTSQRDAPDEIDLLGTAGAPVLKRLAPVLVGVAAAVAVIVWLARR